MWLFTTRGFFSVVEDYENEGMFLVRARMRGDLERLKKIAPAMGPVSESPDKDYRFRASISKADYVILAAALAEEVNYYNFKSQVKATRGVKTANLYGDVWGIMFNAQEEEAEREAEVLRKIAHDRREKQQS